MHNKAFLRLARRYLPLIASLVKIIYYVWKLLSEAINYNGVKLFKQIPA